MGGHSAVLLVGGGGSTSVSQHTESGSELLGIRSISNRCVQGGRGERGAATTSLLLCFSVPGPSDPCGSATALPIPRCSRGSGHPRPSWFRTAPLALASASTPTFLPRAVGSAWVKPSAAWPRVTAWGAGELGGRREGRDQKAAPSRSTARWTPTRRSAGATGASRPEGNGLRCRCLGECLEPCGCRDGDAAASDRPLAMGGGFRRGSAAAESELLGQRASLQGASRSPGPGRPPLPFLLSLETPANRSASWLISGVVLKAPARGIWQTLGAM